MLHLMGRGRVTANCRSFPGFESNCLLASLRMHYDLSSYHSMRLTRNSHERRMVCRDYCTLSFGKSERVHAELAESGRK